MTDHDSIFMNTDDKKKLSIVFIPTHLAEELVEEYRVGYNEGYYRKFLVGNALSGILPLILRREFPEADIHCYEEDVSFVDHLRNLGFTTYTSKDEITMKSMKFDVAIGNPPYGPGGNTAIRFLNKCGDLSDDVRLVLPTSVRKDHSVNKIRLDMICVEDITLPSDTFPDSITVVRQRWVKTNTLREKIETFTTHPDFEFVSYDQRFDADVFIGIKGGGPAGRVKTENFHHYADTGHHLIKCSKEVQERLVSIEPQFRKVALQLQIPSLGKHDLISIYKDNFD